MITIPSKSFPDDPDGPAKRGADLTPEHGFSSDGEPGQWVCWNFRKLRGPPDSLRTPESTADVAAFKFAYSAPLSIRVVPPIHHFDLEKRSFYFSYDIPFQKGSILAFGLFVRGEPFCG
jgi:hypothetical protein